MIGGGGDGTESSRRMTAQLFNCNFKVLGPWGGDRQLGAGNRVRQGQSFSVMCNGGDQRPFGLSGFQAIVVLQFRQQDGAPAINPVTADRQAPVLEVNADLVGASGKGPALYQSEATKLFPDFK